MHRSPCSTRPRASTLGVYVATLVGIPSALCAQSYEVLRDGYEEYYAAWGTPGFGESPRVEGSIVIWHRKGSNGLPRIESVVECVDLRFLEGERSEPIDLFAYPEGRAGVRLERGHVFWGAGGGAVQPHPLAPQPLPVKARRIGPNCAWEGPEIHVSDFGHVIGASAEHVFLRVDPYEVMAEPFASTIVAKPFDRLDEPGTEAFSVVAKLEKPTSFSRTEAVSDRFFVWQDRDPDDPDDTWKVYVLELEPTIAAEPYRVFETNLGRSGAYLAISGSHLVFQHTETPGRDALYELVFVDLERDDPPMVIDRVPRAGIFPDWPSISEEWIVWVTMTDFFRREAVAMPILDGVPTGERIPIGSGGSWIEIDRNLAVMNGGTAPDAGLGAHEAIVVRELPRPEACDVGDVDQDGARSLTDAVVILKHLFGDGPRPRLRLADADGDRALTLTDPVAILQHLFSGVSTLPECR